MSTEVWSAVVSGLALLVAVWSAWRSHALAKTQTTTQAEQTLIQSRLLSLESRRESARQREAKSAELRAEIVRLTRDPELVISNHGAGEARSVTVRVDGQSLIEHEYVLTYDPKELIDTIAPGATAPYRLFAVVGAPDLLKVELEWEDDTGTPKNWRATLRWP